jgi:hypothetical protein
MPEVKAPKINPLREYLLVEKVYIELDREKAIRLRELGMIEISKNNVNVLCKK